MVEVEVVIRDARKAGEGEDGAGGQGGRATALNSSLAVSSLAFSSPSTGIGPQKTEQSFGWGAEVHVTKRPLLPVQKEETPNP